MKLTGYLRMLDYDGLVPVEYYLFYAQYQLDKKKVVSKEEYRSDFSLNSIIGKKVHFHIHDSIRCIECSKTTKKSYNQGFCYVCFTKLAKNDMCILKPTLCHFDKGTCREPDWGKENCFKKHTVYLANTSGLKVGITKENPITNRWVDQGAKSAIPIIEVNSRKAAGEIEATFSKVISDKTSWTKMVFQEAEDIDLYSEKERLLKEVLLPELEEPIKLIPNPKVTQIDYPISKYPSKKTSYKISEGPIIDTLIGIKGQYLLFEKGAINIRAHSGYYFELDML